MVVSGVVSFMLWILESDRTYQNRSPVPVNMGARMRTGAPLAKARMMPAAPTPAPISAEPVITAWMVSPAPCEPVFSRIKPCFLKMPASWPSVGAWFSQLLIWPITSLSVSSAQACVPASARGTMSPSAATMFLNFCMRCSPSLIFSIVGIRPFNTECRPRGKPNYSSPPQFTTAARLCRRPRRFGFLGRGRYPARQAPRFADPHRPVFPRARQASGLGGDLAGHLGFARRQRGDGAADRQSTHMVFGVAGRIDRAEYAVLHAGAGDGDTVALHQHHPVAAERAGERGPLLRLDHQHIGVAEFVVLIPVRRLDAADRAEMEDRHIVGADGEQRHEGRAMVVAHRHDFRPRFVDFAVDYPLGILPDAGIAQRPGIEVVFDEVLRRHQLGCARARQQIAARMVGMAHADVPEGVDDALIGDHAVGERKLGAGFGQFIGH